MRFTVYNGLFTVMYVLGGVVCELNRIFKHSLCLSYLLFPLLRLLLLLFSSSFLVLLLFYLVLILVLIFFFFFSSFFAPPLLSLFLRPQVAKGAVFQEPKGPYNTSQFDHTSVPATLKGLFNLTGFLTQRDRWAGASHCPHACSRLFLLCCWLRSVIDSLMHACP